jgi:hypothetical protein
VTVESNGTAIDLNLLIAFDNHAILVAGSRTGAFVANTSHCPTQDRGLIAAGYYMPTMTGCVAHSNNASH